MIFGLFKKNKDKIATEIYNTIGPHIELAKKFGKIKNGSSFGHEFINDKYLVSFLIPILLKQQNIPTKLKIQLIPVISLYMLQN